jgi:hypothetical protein
MLLDDLDDLDDLDVVAATSTPGSTLSPPGALAASRGAVQVGPVGPENPVMSCEVPAFVHQAAETVAS